MENVFTKKRIRQCLIALVLVLLAIVSCWSSMPAQVQASVVSGLFTVVAAVGGVFVIFWQLRTQAVNTIEANKHNEAMKLKKDVYAEFDKICLKANDARVALSVRARYVFDELRAYAANKKSERVALTPKSRAKDLIEKHTTLASKSMDLVAFVEKWMIIDPRLDVFSYGINAAVEDVGLAYHEFFNAALALLPFELRDEGTIFNTPSDEAITQLDVFGNELEHKLSILDAYIGDFQREMQNELLFDLFGRKLSARVARDKQYRVITLNKSEQLKEYFLNETAWGRQKLEEQRQADEALSTP